MLDKTYYGKKNFVVQPKIIKLGLRMKSHILKIKLKTNQYNESQKKQHCNNSHPIKLPKPAKSS